MTAYLTPFNGGAWVDLARGGRLFRKQILPFTTITYPARNGRPARQITFDRAYATDLAQSFRDGFKDVTSFILSGPSGGHTIDPTRHRGVIKGLEIMPDGLDAIVELSDDETAQMVERNPQLPVSCRIKENVERADGRMFRRALDHVLATLDPVIVGMRPWQAIDLSSDPEPTLDLSALSYDSKEGPPVPPKPKQTTLTLAEEITDEQRQGLAALGLTITEVEPPAPPVIDDLTDEEIAAVLAEVGVDTDADPGDLGDPDLSALPIEAITAIDLANARSASTEARLAEVLTRQATQRWETERAQYIAAGVPPHLIDLAAPLLSQPDEVVLDFSASGGAEVSATDTVRQLLDAMAGTIELSRERGHEIDLGAAGSEQDREDSLLEAWDATDPIDR